MHRWRPWDMVLVVYGFATQTAALQFEWAWQHPDKSIDVRDAAAKVGRKARYGVRGKVLMLMEMLNTSPWKHYPLKIQFLRGEHAQLRAGCPDPPMHVQISVGPLEDLEFLGMGNDAAADEDNTPCVSDITTSQITGAASISQSQSQATTTTKRGRGGASACCICTKAASRTWAVCSSCPVRFHVGCLAEHFLSFSSVGGPSSSSSLPVRGNCPACGSTAAWSDVLATMKHAGWAKHKKKAGGDEPTITEVDEEVDMELPSVPSSPKRVNKKIKKIEEPAMAPAAAAKAAVPRKMPVAPPPPIAPAPAPWLDDAPPNWNCRDAIAAALNKVAGGSNDNNKRQRSSLEVEESGAEEGGSSWPVVEEAAPWDDYDQGNESSGDENENVIDLVSPSPLKSNPGGGGGVGGNVNNIKETEVIELLSSGDE